MVELLSLGAVACCSNFAVHRPQNQCWLKEFKDTKAHRWPTNTTVARRLLCGATTEAAVSDAATLIPKR